MNLRKLAVTGILLAVVAVSFAQVFLWQENGIPIKRTTHVVWEDVFTRLEDNSVVIAWIGTSDTGLGIWAQRYDSMGYEVWGAPILIYDNPGEFSIPVIGSTSDGGFIAGWSISDDYYESDLHCMKYDADGNPLWGDDPVAICETETCQIPAVGIHGDPDGGAYIAWRDGGGTYSSLCVNHVDANGILTWSDGAISVMPCGSDINENTICDDGEGGIVVISHVYNYDDNMRSLYCARVLQDGTTPWGDEGCLLIDQRFSFSYPEVLHPDNNSFIVTYKSQVGGVNRLHYERLSMDGESITGYPVSITNSISYNAILGIPYDAEGNFYTMWSDPEGDGVSVRMQKISPDDDLLWGDGILIDTTEHNPLPMMLDVTPNQTIHVTWREVISESTYKTQLYDTDGTPLWDPDGEVMSQNAGFDIEISTPDAMIFLAYWDNGEMTSIVQQVQTYDGVTLYGTTGTEIVHGGYEVCHNLQAATGTSPYNDRLRLLWNENFEAYSDISNASYCQMIDENGNTSFDENMRLFDDENVMPNILSCCYLNDGSTVVCWKDENVANELHFSAIDDNGDLLWGDDGLTLQTGEYLNLTEVFVQSLGNRCLVSWVEESSEEDDATSTWRLQEIEGGQFVWDDPRIILSEAPDTLSYTRYVDDYLLWIQGDTQLYALRVDDDFNPAEGWQENGNPVALNNGKTKLNVNCLSIDGNLVVSWEDYLWRTDYLRIQIVHGDGTTQWDYGYLLTGVGTYLDGLKMFQADEYLYMLWVDRSSDVPSIFYMQKFDLECNPVWDEPLTLFSEDTICRLLAAAETSVGFLIGYRRSCSSGGYRFGDYDLYLQHVDYDGTAWDEPMCICNQDQDVSDLRFVPAGNNRFFLYWLDGRQGFTEVGMMPYPLFDVYAQFFDLQIQESESGSDAPCLSRLIGNSPNPFNPETTIDYSIASKSRVELDIFNIRGQKVRTLVNETMPSGKHRVAWDASAVASGVYFYRLKAGGKTIDVKKMVMIK